MVPEAGPLAAEPSPLPGAGHVLTGEASANKVNVGPVALRRDIFGPRNVGPVLRQHGATEWINLALPEDRTEPRTLQPQLQTTDAGEERADGQGGVCAH